jgi:hypothetical protein
MPFLSVFRFAFTFEFKLSVGWALNRMTICLWTVQNFLRTAQRCESKLL